MLGLVLLAHSAADRVVISKTPDLVEVVFSGHYPARLAKDPRLEQALNAAAYKHRQLDREDAGGEVSDVFDAVDGAQHFRIQYEPHRSGWTLGAVVGGRLEPLLHARSSQRHSPVAEVATQWFVPADGGGNAAEVATLDDVRCEYVSDAAKRAAVELKSAAEEADAAVATKAAEELRATQEHKAAEEARRVEEQHKQHAMEEVEAQKPAREAPGLSGRPSGRREVPSSAARNKSNTDAIVTGLIGFVALLFLLLVLALWLLNLPADPPPQGAVVGQSRRGVFDRDRRVYSSGVPLLELLDW